VIADFTFQADDHTFGCRIETARTAGAQPWWWFNVSGDEHRYAPFQSDASDTVESVQLRIASYYRALLARRELPLDMRTTWQLRRQNLAALKR
jgi:hypothetical protein